VKDVVFGKAIIKEEKAKAEKQSSQKYPSYHK
jgi:hypothetical protein